MNTRPRPSWTRRRSTLGVFAALAAVGFLGAYAGPASIALAAPRPVMDEPGTTSYAAAVGDPQSLVVSSSGAGTGAALTRSSYTVYETPKPTPTQTASQASASSGSGSGGAPRYSGGGAPAEWMTAAGIAESDWGYVNYIVSHESGWNPNATSSNGYCGLVQTECGKLGAGTYDPVANLSWGTGYANGRYGSWAGAYDFWASHGWW
ncbi:transglycosylase SLT domain-containing protein [Microbacterium sp. X-17]|uniref:aggregation-promoting factor C-terminal-like domain-containing protein n=1 Tax=Microbacterium sp. X-17 TaxID=3144404 RepID=UPI0031F545CF